MARKKGSKGKAKAKTAAMIALEDAKKVLKDAEEKLEASDTDANKKAVETAKKAVETALVTANDERFLSVGGGRVAVALTKLAALERVANRKLYNFTESDANDIIKAVNDAAKKVENAFKAALATTAGKSAKATFQFTRAAAPKA